MKRRVITIRNSEGHALHCMLEEPARDARPGIFAVLLCPGIKTRTGSHRLYRKLVPAFLERGISVMRVDFRGLGDSDGQWPDDRLEAIYHRIEMGGCTGDARAALDWLEEHAGGRHFIVGGLCGAATTGVLLAAADWRVSALYAIGLPVLLHDVARAKGKARPVALANAEVRFRGREYLRKLFAPRSWLRLLALRSDYRLMWRLAVETVASRLGARRANRPVTSPDVHPLLAPAFLSMLADRCPALLMFGERDRYRWSFEERFLVPLRAALAPHAALLDHVTIAGANHILSDPGAVTEAVRITGAWLDARFNHGPAPEVLRTSKAA